MQLTIEDLKQLIGGTNEQTNSMFEVGQAYLFRTVTHYDLGVVEEVQGNFVKLKNASWIADTGRFYDFLKNGNAKEVEPYPDFVIVSLGALVDAAPWAHDLPDTQKP